MGIARKVCKHTKYSRIINSEWYSLINVVERLTFVPLLWSVVILQMWTYKTQTEKAWWKVLRAVLNKFWKQHSMKQQLYHHLPPISKTIQVRRTTHAGHSCRSKDKLKCVIFFMNPYTWLNNKNLFASTLCGHRIQFERPAGSDRW